MITKEKALKLRHGDTIYELGEANAIGTPKRWSVNGAIKLWKTRPKEFKVPIKHGLRTHDYLTHENAHLLTTDEAEAETSLK